MTIEPHRRGAAISVQPKSTNRHALKGGTGGYDAGENLDWAQDVTSQ